MGRNDPRGNPSLRVQLPRIRGGTVTLEEAIRTRRTSRTFSGAPITLEALSQLLWAAQGVTGASGERTVPSAGSQYPLHAYVVAESVSDLSPGLYEYDVEHHALDFLAGDNRRLMLDDATIDDQPWVREAAAIIGVTADFRRMGDHFAAQPPRGERGARYAYLETGALAQNVYLQATALGLGAVLVCGFDDDKVKAVLRTPPALGPTALICVGTK